MPTQSYGGRGLFGQPRFGDYSGLSQEETVPMDAMDKRLRLANNRLALAQQNLDDYVIPYSDKIEQPSLAQLTSAFNANVNSRYMGLPTNPYVNPPPDPLRTALLQADYIKQQEGNPVEAINQMDVRKDLPPAPNGQMWEFDANSNQYVLVDDPLSNLSQDASQTAPVASAQQVVRPAPPIAPAPASASSSIIPGMFPEVDAMQRALYQQKQNEAMQAQAMQYASLDPMARAQYSLYLGGQQLGGAIGGALGAKDPQLQMIGLQQQILRELDPSDPAQNIRVAQKYAQVAPDLAMKIADNARSSLVKIKQASGAARQGTTEKLQILDRLNQVNDALQTISPDTPEYKTLLNNKSLLESQLKKAENTPDKIQIAERIAINKGFTQGSEEFNKEVAKQLERPEKDTQIEQLQSYRDQLINSKAPASKIAEVEAVIKSLGEGTAPKIILPGQPVAPKDWLAFSSQISKDPIMDRTSTVISDAPSAIETIRMSTTNDIAAASLPGALAKLTGEGKNMSDRDIARYARTGGLTDRVAQDVVGFFTGQRTSVTKEQAERFATAVYRGALLERKKFIQDQAEQAGYKDTPNYTIAIRQLDDQLAKFKLIKPNEKTSSEQKQTSSDDELINKYRKPK